MLPLLPTFGSPATKPPDTMRRLNPPALVLMEYRFAAPDLLATCATRPLLDVRSPGEYAQGHVPGAVSFPLFTDAERAAVGTIYKQQSRELALEKGLELVGPKLAGFVRTARTLAPDGQIAVHCWRGGQRSGSVAWLLRQGGLDVLTLEGGYKAYRHWVLAELVERRYALIVIGGRTGTGKTKILHALRQLGEQIIDLEGLACHKGSAFGFIGERPQPTVEQFENDLHTALHRLDPARRIWVENESHSIGRIYIPDGFWRQMKVATMWNVQIPLAARLQNLLDDYVGTDRSDLEMAFGKLERKLGGQHLKAALEALQRDDYAAAAEIALYYYDKTYQHGLENSLSVMLQPIEFDHGDPMAIARQLIKDEGAGVRSQESGVRSPGS